MWTYASLAVFFAALMLGVFLGTLTGLIPGFHPNNVAVILVSISPVLMRELHFLAPSDFSVIVASAILATAVTHTFLSFIPVNLMYLLILCFQSAGQLEAKQKFYLFEDAVLTRQMKKRVLP